MSNNSSVKILLSYYKPATLIKSDILTPIHTGRAICNEVDKDGRNGEERNTQWLLDNMIGDDTGENISKKKPYVCRAECSILGVEKL